MEAISLEPSAGVSAFLAVRHGYVEREGLALHHLDFGGEGATAVCVHGVAGNAWVWHDVAAAFREHARVIALDLRGHGDSQWSAGGEYSTDQHVADLAAFLDASGLTEVDLIGSSWGALVALEYTSRHPGRVRRLTVVDVEPSFEQGETDLFPRPRAFHSYEEVAALERRNNPHAPPTMIEVMARTGTRPGADGELVPKHDPFFFERWPFRSDDHWGELELIDAPTLLAHAGKSFVRGSVMEEMAALLRHSTLVEIAGLEPRGAGRRPGGARRGARGLPLPRDVDDHATCRRRSGESRALRAGPKADKEEPWAHLRGGWRSSPGEHKASAVPIASALPRKGQRSWWRT